MAKTMLAIAKQEGLFSGVQIEKQGLGFFAGINIDLSSNEALHLACSEAEEIYINTVFPSEIYSVKTFPKVKKKYLPKLLLQNVIEQSYSKDEVGIEYKTIGNKKDETGVEQQIVAYVAIDQREIDDLLFDFKKYHRKIKAVKPLPVSLANIVIKTDQIEADFIMVLIGESESIIAIASPQGIVKVSRSIPVGLQESDMSVENDADYISSRIIKEMNRTITFFKHEFRETEPKAAYIFSKQNTIQSLSGFFISHETMDYRFGLNTSLIQNYSAAEFAENIQIVSSALSSSEFNFLKKKSNKVEIGQFLFYPALIICILAVIGLFVSNFQLASNISQQHIVLTEKYNIARELKGQVEDVEIKIGKLSPLKDWNIFYNQTFKNQIAWDKIFSELAHKLPPNIIFKSLGIGPYPNDIFKAEIDGDVIAVNWQEGLELLREFGAKIESSEEFKTIDIKYTPEGIDNRQKNFNFSLSLEIRKHAI